MVSSIVSRVVPGISDTIALSSIRRAFNNVITEFGSYNGTGIHSSTHYQAKRICQSCLQYPLTFKNYCLNFSLSAIRHLPRQNPVQVN